MWLSNMILVSFLTGALKPRGAQSFAFTLPGRPYVQPLAARHFASNQRVRPFPTNLSAQVGTPATAFDDGKRPYQITTPIYYVNDKPHIGHAYTSTGEWPKSAIILVDSISLTTKLFPFCCSL